MVQAQAHDISEILRQDSLLYTTKQHMVRSKYGMLEIFRATYNRTDAVIILRQLNKRFLGLSTDPYLDIFTSSRDIMFYEVRKDEDLQYFRKMIRYASLSYCSSCLQIEFFWNF